MNMLTIVRVHYTIDIAGGMVFALWMSKNTKRLIYFSDRIISQPYVWGGMVRQWWRERQRRKVEERGEEMRETLLTEERE